MKKNLAITTIITALLFNCVMGAICAPLIGINPIHGAIGANAISAIVGSFAPAGALYTGVHKEVWTGEMIKAFRITEEMVGWYKRIRSYDDKVDNDVIHFVNIGGAPEVLINNTTYPIGVSDLNDTGKPVGLDKYQTKRTIVTDDELHAISYPKMKSTIERHKEAIEEKKFAKAIHAIAPTKHAKGTPVVATSGAVVDGRKAITHTDILKLKKAFDVLKVPASDRILVLCPDHVNDLLGNDQKFANQYYNYATGKIGRMYGFEIYEYTDCPHYVIANGEKVPFGAAISEGTHSMASVAFAASKCMRADGSLKMYHKAAETNPEMQESEVNFRTYSICLPLSGDCIGAIYSANA